MKPVYVPLLQLNGILKY